MGDRALIQLTDGKNMSPVLYLQWHGSEALEIIQETGVFMEGQGGNIEYAFARLVQVACGRDPASNTGIGVYNETAMLTENYLRRDHGCFVVDISNPAGWAVFVIHADALSSAEVAKILEQRHKGLRKAT